MEKHLTEKQRTANSTYPKGGVSCSKDSYVINQTLVFQIKFCGKSPALRVAAKRYRSCYDDSATTNDSAKNEKKSPCFAKSKEKQRHPQANAKLLHICFCPYAPRLFTTSFYF